MWCPTVLLLFFLVQVQCITYYLMPVCGRLTPGMKVRFYASLHSTEWIIQFHVARQTVCNNAAMDLNTDRPFHVNHYFIHPTIPNYNRHFAIAAGTSNTWQFTHWYDMSSDVQQNTYIQCDVYVVNGGYDYYVNARYIGNAYSDYSNEQVDCVLATPEATVQYMWIEGQPDCPYRVNDTIRPGYGPSTAAPTTATPTTGATSLTPPTGSTSLPTPPPYFPPPGWPYCIPPYCYPYITYPCHPLCYTNCSVYCPPACYIIPNYGYQPPPVYPSCNLVNLPTCIPYYGVAPYYTAPIGYVQPQCQYLPGTWPWIINWPPYPQTTPFPTSNPTGSTPLTSGTFTWPTSNPTGSTGGTSPSTRSTGATGIVTTPPTSPSTGATGGTSSFPSSPSTASTGGTSTFPSSPSTASTGGTSSLPSSNPTQSTNATPSSPLTSSSSATQTTPSSTQSTTPPTTVSSTTQSTTPSTSPTSQSPIISIVCPNPPRLTLTEGQIYPAPGCLDANGNPSRLACADGTIPQVGSIIPLGCFHYTG